MYRRAAASEEQIRSGELEFEPSPQGIFTERLRAGAGGIAAFFSPVGAIAPEDVTVPGIYVDRVVLHDKSRDEQSESDERQRRRRRCREVAATKPLGLTQDQMAVRAAQLLKPGEYVNLGMGIPTKVANYITADSGVLLHAENGILGYGPEPSEDE